MTAEVWPLHRWYAGPPRARGSVLLAACDAATLQAHSRPDTELLFLTELWVPPNGRGRGYAHALLSAATEWATKEHVDLWLYCAPHGPEPRLTEKQLQALYRSYGFRRVARRSPDIEMLRRWYA